MTQLPLIDYQMDFPTYLADPCEEPSLTSGTVRDLLSGAPAKVWMKNRRINPHAVEVYKRIFDLGTVAHKLFLGVGDTVTVIDAVDYRTKSAQLERAAAYALGETPILAHEMDKVMDMTNQANIQFSQNPDLKNLIGSEIAMPEVSMFWREAGVTCRCRPDLFIKNLEIDGFVPTVIHYKTTSKSINPYMLPRYAADQGWDLIAAHYGSGIRLITGRTAVQYFAVQENTPPYLCLTATLDDAFIANATMRRERALNIWATCLQRNEWPGHITSTVELVLPAWHENSAIEEKDAVQAIHDSGNDPLDLAANITVIRQHDGE